MKKEIKIPNILLKFGLIIANILLVGIFIATLIVKTDFINALYWCFLPFLIIILIWCINNWGNFGLNVDLYKSKLIQGEFNNVVSISTIIFGFIYSFIIFFNDIDKMSYSNIYLKVGFFLLIILYEFIICFNVVKTNEKTKQLVEKFYFENSKNNK